MDTLRVKLQNKVLDKELQEKGFIRIPNLYDSKLIEELKTLYASYHTDHTDRHPLFWNSMNDVPTQQGLELSAKILNIIRPSLIPLLSDFETPVAQFMSKNFGPNTEVNLHRDTTIFEEEKYTYINLWIPLVDATPQTGCLYVVPYSHRVFTYCRLHVFPWHYDYMRQDLNSHLAAVEVNAGDCVIFCDRMLHGSFSNLSAQFRPAVYLGAIAPNAQVSYYYYEEKSNQVRVYAVPGNFYFEKDFSEPKGKYPLMTQFEFNPPHFTFAEVSKKLYDVQN